MKLPEKSQQVFDYVKENGGRVTIDEIASALGRDVKSVNGTVTALGCKGKGKGLVDYEKITVEGVDKPVKYVFLTEAGQTFVPSEDDED